VKRGNGNAVAEAHRHRLDQVPVVARAQRAATLAKLDLDLVEEAHLLEEFALPGGADLLRDLRRADVRAFHHDLGHRAGAIERMGVVDGASGDVKRAGAIVHLAHRLDRTVVHRHCHGERLEGRAKLIDAERCAIEARLHRAIAAALGLSCGSEVIASISPVWMFMMMPAAPIAENSFTAP
jgi:hypothetical protein